CHQRSSYPLTF
nr:immunoglobulin light chain junction region [Mus musculus]NSL97627.1 immunoglobulin light chain junction region [Mus musculus]NSM01506.1 immunoglobulin light chain junction region [Mus musculus]